MKNVQYMISKKSQHLGIKSWGHQKSFLSSFEVNLKVALYHSFYNDSINLDLNKYQALTMEMEGVRKGHNPLDGVKFCLSLKD